MNTARQRLNMLLLTAFAVAGLLMAAMGIYGVMSYSVQQRTQELGIHMAFGAQALSLRNMVIRQGVTLALVGMLMEGINVRGYILLRTNHERGLVSEASFVC